jgi:hypothetical protein
MSGRQLREAKPCCMEAAQIQTDAENLANSVHRASCILILCPQGRLITQPSRESAGCASRFCAQSETVEQEAA